MAAAIEGYASVSSAAPGETVDFHVRADQAHSRFTMRIYRRASVDQLVQTVDGDAFVAGAQDDAALAVNGCDWPAAQACRTLIPPQWRSGYYGANLTSGDAATWIPFVVRSAAPGTTSRILLKLSDSTAQAYTGWGGRSLYTEPHVPNISFDRPYDDVPGLYEKYQLPFLGWAETNGIDLEYCSSLDLHTDPRILAPYRLLISLGHDEYWSLEMRDQVEAFIAAGGNVAFFSANTCYWQVRLDLNGRRIMTCYKETEAAPDGSKRPPDPQRDDPRRVTVRWYEPPVLRPESRLTGVSYKYGAGWWYPNPIDPQKRFRGYTVTDASHWVYAGTGLSNGDVFGNGTTEDDAILGYETDAAHINGDAETPRTFTALADADLTDWGPGGQAGRATMGLYQRNGIAFTAGTVNWVGGLSPGGDSTPVDWITQRVLRELSRESPPAVAVANAGFEDWTGGAPTGWIRDGAGTVSATPADPDALANQMRFGTPGNQSLKVDAAQGETWISCAGLALTGGASYGAGAWVKSSTAGATVRLQSTDTWTDFAVAAHSGSGEWEYVFAIGSPNRGAAAVPARVKLQVAAGGQAVYDDVSVVEIVDHSLQ